MTHQYYQQRPAIIVTYSRQKRPRQLQLRNDHDVAVTIIITTATKDEHNDKHQRKDPETPPTIIPHH